MKLLPVILLIGIIAISPLFFEDVFATHVTGSLGTNYDDQFWYKEIDDTVGFCSTNDYSINGFQLETTDGASSNFCTMFKVFDKEDINGKEITMGASFFRTGGQDVTHFTKIYDGNYTASSSTDFPTDDFLLKGNGELYSSGGTVNPTNPFTPSFTASEDDVTIFFIWLEDNSGLGNVKGRMSSIDIEDLGRWDFCFSGSSCADARVVVNDVTGTSLDYGNFWSYNHDFANEGQVTDLVVGTDFSEYLDALPDLTTFTLVESTFAGDVETVSPTEFRVDWADSGHPTATHFTTLQGNFTNPLTGDFSLDFEVDISATVNDLHNSYLAFLNSTGDEVIRIGFQDSHATTGWKEQLIVEGNSQLEGAYNTHDVQDYAVNISRTGTSITTSYGGSSSFSDTCTDCDDLHSIFLYMSLFDDFDTDNEGHAFQFPNSFESTFAQEINWSKPVTDSDDSLIVTGYEVQIKTGILGESDFWSRVANIGDVEAYNMTSGLTQAHPQTVRLITLGNTDFLSNPSNEATFTAGGTELEPIVFNEVFERDTGIDNRFYYRDSEIKGFQSTDNWASGCLSTSMVDGAGFKVGTTDAGLGTCFAFVKSFPTVNVIDKEWIFDNDYHRSIAGVYHNMKVYDGLYDVYNSTDFPDGSPFLLKGAGVLYNSGGTVNPTETFTPTGATEDNVTVFMFLEDDDSSGDDVTTTMRTLSIDGLSTFFVPNTSALQTQYPIIQQFTSTNHDMGYITALFTPPASVLTIEQSSNNAVLTWTEAVDAYSPTATGYKIEKECPVADGWKTLVDNTGDATLTYTDTNFLDAVVTIEQTFNNVGDWDFTDQQNPDFITIEEGGLHFGVEADLTDTRGTLDTGGVLDDALWVMEFTLDFDRLGVGSNANHFFFGFTDEEFLNIGLDDNDFIGMYITYAGGGIHDLYLASKDGSTLNLEDTGYNFVDDDEDDVIYTVEVKRNTTTSATMNLFLGSSVDYDNVLATVTQSDLASTVDGLTHVVASGWEIAIADERNLGGFIDNFLFGNSTSYVQAEETQCNYRVSGINTFGTGESSNEASLGTSGVSLTSPDALTCGANGKDSVILTWNYSGSEIADGFRIDGETPKNSMFSTFVSDTQSSTTTHTVTGLLENTEYNFKVAVIFGGDTSGFSNEYSCKTTGSSGSGGGGSPSDPIIIDDDIDIGDTDSDDFETIISDGDDPVFDLAFPFIQELTNTFSGDIFTLVGGQHFVSLGQTVTGNLLIGWDNTDNIIVSSLIIADSQMSIQPIPLPPYFVEGGQVLSQNELEKLSLILPDLPNIKSHQLLPYEITIPNAFCGTGFVPCIEAGTHKIPIKVVSTQGGENVANSARIEVTVGVPQIQLDIPTFVMFALVAIGLVGAFMVTRRFKKNKQKGVHV